MIILNYKYYFWDKIECYARRLFKIGNYNSKKMLQISEFESKEKLSRFTYRVLVKHIVCIMGYSRKFIWQYHNQT